MQMDCNGGFWRAVVDGGASWNSIRMGHDDGGGCNGMFLVLVVFFKLGKWK